MAFERVAQVADVPPSGRLRVEVRGVEVGIFRVGDEWFAMENRCPHAGDPLSEGELEGHCIVCRAHGWRFDVRSGFRPGFEDGFPIPCFAVRVEGDALSIDLDAPLNLRRRRG